MKGVAGAAATCHNNTCPVIVVDDEGGPMTALTEQLAEYQRRNKLTTKGKLAAILFVSNLAKTKGLPLDSGVLVTDSQGQVLGLGKSAVQSILRTHGETRVLAEEGGRTSRGSLGNMLCATYPRL